MAADENPVSGLIQNRDDCLAVRLIDDLEGLIHEFFLFGRVERFAILFHQLIPWGWDRLDQLPGDLVVSRSRTNPPGKVAACCKPIAKLSCFMVSTYSRRYMVLSPNLMQTAFHIAFNNSPWVASGSRAMTRTLTVSPLG